MRKSSVLLAILIVLCAASAFAQTSTGSIRGTVTDATQAVLPGATVTVTNEDTGLIRATVTNSAGVYSVPALPVGLGTAYEKVTDRTTLEPVCGVAAGARLAADGTLDSVRLALTGATFRPVRLTDAERALTGTRLPVDAEPLPIGELAGFVDDAIASATYRAHLTRVLVKRALSRAVTRRVPDPGTPG